MRVAESERKRLAADAAERLRKVLPEGGTVWCLVTGVASSGMSRSILPMIVDDGRIRPIGYEVAHICGLRRLESGAVHIRGCGMDMTWALVNELAFRLYGKGDALRREGL